MLSIYYIQLCIALALEFYLQMWTPRLLKDLEGTTSLVLISSRYPKLGATRLQSNFLLCSVVPDLTLRYFFPTVHHFSTLE